MARGDGMSRESGILVGWVYLIGTADRVKVGYTGSHPSIRVADLQAGSPVLLESFGIVRGTQLIERTLHAYFHEHHWMNEWFHRAPLIDDFIREISDPWSAASEIEGTLYVADHDFLAMMNEISDRVVGWLESRGVEPGAGPLQRRNGRKGSIATRPKPTVRPKPVFPVFDPLGCPMDYEEAMRPDRLLREAVKLIAPEWRVAFLRHVRGERVAPGLLSYLVGDTDRLSAVEAAFAETSDRMRHFAGALEDVIDEIPCPGTTSDP
jgi:hypothetical protein